MNEIVLKGEVLEGKGEGRKLGFPTANILAHEAIAAGIYCAVVVIEGKAYRAAAFVNRESAIVESHILDFAQNLYGVVIEVTLKEKIRDIVPYESDEQMKKLIAQDVQHVRKMGEA